MKVSKFTLPALAGVPLIMVLGNSLLIPVLPAIQSAVNISKVQVSLIITLFSIPAGLIIPVAGFLSDRFGRKKVIIPSLILYGSGGIIAGLAAIFLKENSFNVILAGRVIQGIGAAGTAPIAMALCGDLWQGKERSKSLGIIEASNGMGKVISPVLGAVLGLFFWYAAFIFFPVIVIPVIIANWLLVKEPDKHKEPLRINTYIKSVKKIFKKKAPLMLSCFLTGAAALMLLFGVLFFLSDYLEKALKYDGIIKGALLAVPVLFMSTTSYITGTLIKKQIALMKILVLTGLTLIALSLGILPFFRNIYVFFTGISIAGVGTGLVLPCLNMLITSATDSEERGMVTSLYGSVRFFGVAFGPPIFGWLMDLGQPIMFWSASALAAFAAVIAFFFIKVRAITQSTAEEDEQKKTAGSLNDNNAQAKQGLLVYISPQGATTVITAPAKKPVTNQDNENQANNGDESTCNG